MQPVEGFLPASRKGAARTILKTGARWPVRQALKPLSFPPELAAGAPAGAPCCLVCLHGLLGKPIILAPCCDGAQTCFALYEMLQALESVLFQESGLFQGKFAGEADDGRNVGLHFSQGALCRVSPL